MFVRDTPHWQGTASAKVSSMHNSVQNMGIHIPVYQISANVNYTFSVYARTSVPRNHTMLTMEWRDANGALLGRKNSDTFTTTPGPWVRLTVTGTAPNGAQSCDCFLVANDMNPNDSLWWDGAQLEQKAYPTGWQESGISRDNETLTIPTTGILNASQGTLEISAYIDPSKMHSASSPNWSMLFTTVDIQNSPYLERNQINIRRYPNGRTWMVRFSNASGNYAEICLGDITTAGWYDFAATWKAGTGGYGYLNGVQKGSVAASYLPSTIPAIAYIGSWLTQDINKINQAVKDLRISNTLHTAAQIQATRQGGHPYPVENDTTLKLPLNGTLEPTYNSITYQYSTSNTLNSVSTPSRLYSYQYDANGNLTRRQ